MPPHGGPRPTNRSLNWVWDINTLQWVMMTQPLISGGTITVVGVATETNQTNGNQKTQIVDAGGEVATITGGRLDVNSTGLTNTELRAAAVLVTTKADLTPSSPTFASVGITSALALAANANRKGLILVNTHATQRISIAFGAAAVLDSGITLYPQGSFNMAECDFDLGAVNAIASGASTNMAIQEFTT